MSGMAQDDSKVALADWSLKETAFSVFKFFSSSSATRGGGFGPSGRKLGSGPGTSVGAGGGVGSEGDKDRVLNPNPPKSALVSGTGQTHGGTFNANGGLNRNAKAPSDNPESLRSVSWKFDVNHLLKILAGARPDEMIEIFSAYTNEDPAGVQNAWIGINFGGRQPGMPEFHARLPLVKLMDHERELLKGQKIAMRDQFYQNKVRLTHLSMSLD